MFERFSVSAREVILLAREVAWAHGFESIQSPHLLLVLIRTDPELMGQVMTSNQIDILRGKLEAMLTSEGPARAIEELSLSSETKHALRIATKEARSRRRLGHGPYTREDLLEYWRKRTGQILDPSTVHPTLRSILFRQHWEVEPGHILFGLLCDEGAVVMKLLTDLGISSENLRNRMQSMIVN